MVDPPVESIDPKGYADICYAFMTGLPGHGSAGFCMMPPSEVMNQRITYVRYWMRRLTNDLNALRNST